MLKDRNVRVVSRLGPRWIYRCESLRSICLLLCGGRPHRTCRAVVDLVHDVLRMGRMGHAVNIFIVVYDAVRCLIFAPVIEEDTAAAAE